MRWLPFAVAVLLVTGQVLAEEKKSPCKGHYNDKYVVTYSKINDATTYKAKKLNQDDGRLRLRDEKGKELSDRKFFCLSLGASFPGKVLASGAKGAKFQLTFSHFEIPGSHKIEGQGVDKTYSLYQEDPTLVMLIDGKKKDFKVEHSTRTDKDILGIMFWEMLTVTLTETELMELANSTAADGELCGIPFTLTFDQRCFLKDIVERAKAGEPVKK